MSNTKTAIIYTRYSPRRDEETSESCETQEDLCRDYAQRHDLDIRRVYADRALSGADADRPGLWAAVADLRRGDALLVYRLDRLARDVLLSLTIDQQVSKKGARIVSASGEGNGPTDEAWLVRAIQQVLAEYERRQIRRRTSEAMLRHQRQGRRMGSIPPFGYKEDPEDDALLVQDDREQAIIEQMRTLREDDGMSYREIARTLTEAGLSPRQAEKWSHVTIRAILKRQ